MKYILRELFPPVATHPFWWNLEEYLGGILLYLILFPITIPITIIAIFSVFIEWKKSK